MKRSIYLQVVLTIIAVLLSVQVWVTVAERPLLSTEAGAVPAPPSSGIPDAGSQRKQIIDAIKELSKHVEKTNEILEEAKIKVEVTNVQDLRGKADGDARP